MAEVSKQLWTGYDPASDLSASISYVYDDALLRIVSFTLANPTTRTVQWSATSTSNGRNYSGTIQPGSPEATITLNNNQAANRLNITITPNGRIDGVEYSIQFG